MSHLWRATLVTSLAALCAVLISFVPGCSGSPKPAPKDVNAAAKDAVIGAELLCAARGIGVQLGQVPPDADADAQCAKLESAQDACGAGGAR